MAEIVQSKSENMIKELEDLRQTKLLPEDFIRRVLKMRKQMESKTLGKVGGNIEDYKNYINHEMLILEKLRKCRDKKKISEKKSSVDYSIVKRVRRLYETALQRFPSDYSLHEGFFTFCEKNKFNTTASQAVDNMIKLFPYRSEVWKLAANWYHHMDPEKALETLQKGLTMNPESTLLYTTAIKMELELLTQVDSKEDKLFQLNKSCAKIKAYVNLILNNVKNLDYIISVLRILQEHTSTNQAQELILDYLFKNHAKEDIVWQTLAVRERKGMHFQTDPKEEPRSGAFTKSCIFYCIDKFKQGLTLVSEDKKKKLWSHYLETLIAIKEENHTSATTSRIDLLKEALEEAHKTRYLEERHYSVWVEIIPDNEARHILEESTCMYPQSEELWKLRLRYAIITDKVPMVTRVFQEGVLQLKERALNLWLMVLRFHLLVSDSTNMKFIFERGLKEPPEISNVLKPKYIEWIVFHEGIEAARAKYRAIATLRPYCKELHLLMAKLEFTEMTINHKAWQEVLELACEQFGSEDVDVWINFLKFLIFKKTENSNEMISRVYSESKQRLPPFLWEEFKEKYATLMAES